MVPSIAATCPFGRLRAIPNAPCMPVADVSPVSAATATGGSGQWSRTWLPGRRHDRALGRPAQGNDLVNFELGLKRIAANRRSHQRRSVDVPPRLVESMRGGSGRDIRVYHAQRRRKGAAELSNPFDDNDGTFFALINDEGQHSLWPTFADVPDGWQVVCGPDSRDTCLNYIEKEWTDMRPKSLVAAMESAAEGRRDVLSTFCRRRIWCAGTHNRLWS